VDSDLGLQVFSSCKPSTPAARAAASGAENRAGQDPRAAISCIVEFKFTGREHGTAASGGNVGFQVLFTRGQYASSPGSGPGTAVARTG
jgi:hypothetical protein